MFKRNKLLFLVIFAYLILGALACVAARHVSAAEPSDSFYQWTLPNGDISMTDDVKRIPANYRDIAVKRSFAQVGRDANMAERTVPNAEYQASLERKLDRSRKAMARTAINARIEGCDGFITVGQERRNHKERDNTYNSLFYVVRDSCGNVKSVTRQNPELLGILIH